MNLLTLPDSLSLITAPMINQSDLPFRLLTRRHGATLTYTQMLEPHKLLNDRDYLDFHLRDLQFCRDGYDDLGILGRPVVVQLCGNDPEIVVKAGKQVQGLCDAIVCVRFLSSSHYLIE
jgi:tRNA-dihydrouridine synthase 1